MADYLSLALTVVAINLVPIFMPPTWFVLAFAKINDPSFDPLLLTLVGALSSTFGRAGLSYYSSFFRRFFTKELSTRADEIKKFFDRRGRELFLGAFTYSLSPFPSSMLFIADGLTKVDSRPVLAGYFCGRLVSYYVLIVLSSNLYSRVSGFFHGDARLRYALDLIGILGALSVVLVDWKKVAGVGKKTGK